MDDGNEKPACLEAGTDDVIDDDVAEGHHGEPEQPEVRLARRRAAPRLERDLLTYRNDRYAPVFAAVADKHHSIMVIQQALGPFLVQSKAPTVVFVDDVSGLGPGGFDAASLRVCVRRCEGAVIIVGDRSPALYAVAAEMAEGKKRRALLVETRPARLADWERSLLTARPSLRIAVGADPIDGASG